MRDSSPAKSQGVSEQDAQVRSVQAVPYGHGSSSGRPTSCEIPPAASHSSSRGQSANFCRPQQARRDMGADSTQQDTLGGPPCWMCLSLPQHACPCLRRVKAARHTSQALLPGSRQSPGVRAACCQSDVQRSVFRTACLAPSDCPMMSKPSSFRPFVCCRSRAGDG